MVDNVTVLVLAREALGNQASNGNAAHIDAEGVTCGGQGEAARQHPFVGGVKLGAENNVALLLVEVVHCDAILPLDDDNLGEFGGRARHRQQQVAIQCAQWL